MKDITLPPENKWHAIIIIVIVAIILYYALGRYQGIPSTSRTVVSGLTGQIGASNYEIPHSTY